MGRLGAVLAILSLLTAVPVTSAGAATTVPAGIRPETVSTSDNLFWCGISTSGAAKCWGWNKFGQLGDGTTTDRTNPVQVVGLTSGIAQVAAGGNHACARTTAGAVKCWGANGSGDLGNGTTRASLVPVQAVGATSGVRAIAAGYQTSCLVTTGGAVKCWGWNEFGQLGDHPNSQVLVPTQQPGGFTSGYVSVWQGTFGGCASPAGGPEKCWGEGRGGPDF